MIRRHDRGSATIWVLVCVALLVAVSGAVVVRTLAVLGRHRAESAADLAALAGAQRIGLAGDPCTAAQANAAANRARVIRCDLHLDAGGRSGRVTVTVRLQVRLPLLGSVPVDSSARAGRLPATARGEA